MTRIPKKASRLLARKARKLPAKPTPELDEFINLVGHELKTPLTSQRVYIQLLQRLMAQHKNALYDTYLQKVVAQTDKITRLIGDLLDVSTFRAGKMKLALEKFNLTALVHEVVADYQKLETTYIFQVKGSIQTKVLGDQERITQVLNNFLSNAVKYSPTHKTILILLKEDQEQAVVSIIDKGIGIDPKFQKKIFRRYFRASGKNEETFPGMGVGLYISAEIVRKHGGEIKVESQPGAGSTFTFSLPLNAKVA